jgi:hypothetical protein
MEIRHAAQRFGTNTQKMMVFTDPQVALYRIKSDRPLGQVGYRQKLLGSGFAPSFCLSLSFFSLVTFENKVDPYD